MQADSSKCSGFAESRLSHWAFGAWFSDYFDQYASVYSEGLVKDLKPVLEYSEDFDAIALLATRKVTRMIFLERMRCPATKFDMFTVSKY